MFQFKWKSPPADLMRIRSFAFLAIMAFTCASHGFCQDRQAEYCESAVWYDYEVVNVYPHDHAAFTQGLVFLNGFLYESTGLNGYSTLRKVNLYTGVVLQKYQLLPQFFAEGMTDWKDTLVQLTYRSGLGFIYDMQSMRVERTFTYTGEGWGLTRDEDRLIMSDGTTFLRFLDPTTHQEIGRLSVTDNGLPLSHLNELELIKGKLFANVWPSNHIVIIDLSSGIVVGKVNLSGIVNEYINGRRVDVLNGIAYDSEKDRLFVTGKWWPVLFEIRLKPRM